MSLIKKLFGLDAAAHLERAERYEQSGKLGMAQLELERALDTAGAAATKERERINARMDALAVKQHEDAEVRAQEALQAGDQSQARYYFNAALSKLEEGSPAYNNIVIQLNSLPEDPEEARLENELTTVFRADAGVDFVDRQRTLEFWKSGVPPYKEEYYFNKALTSELVLAQSEQVAKSPDDADAWFNFGVTLAQLGLVKKALDQIRHFVELKPDDRDGHYFLANLLADQGYDDEAVREFEKTIALDPNFHEAYFYLAKHYLNLADEQRAERILEHLLSQDQVSELAEEARAQLNLIREKGKARASQPA
ncbi:MAG: tetratricopeptide repeat protein [Acidobacteria bacterium]|nr:tetratricopeptide repeat protein [Acidobacteriota bacterium]MCI0624912.1 tetratricopeptide repeat protein [Acidobacteriota bacterium]